jgi:hypothetical protein
MHLIRLLTLSLLLLPIATPAKAQRVDPMRIIDLHVNAEGQNRSFGGSVPEGKGFRLTFERVGTFEIVPVILDAAAQTFRVTVYRGAIDGEFADMRAVETLTARRGVVVNLRSMPSVGLMIEAVRLAPRAQAAPVRVSFASTESLARVLQQDFCCVSCGGVIACACRVTSACGTCCVAPCCPPPVETSGNRFVPTPRGFAACGSPIRNEERGHTASGQRMAVAMAR